MALTKVPSNLDATIATTQSQADNSTNIATTAYVDLAVSSLSDSAPAALNTLNEIAAALGDDANYASTTTAAIAAKLPLAGGTMTGNLTVNAIVDADNYTINGGQGSDGQVLTSTGSGVAWEAISAGGVDGIVSSANATAITIDSAETIFHKTTSPTLHSAVTGIVFENGSLLNDVTRGDGKSITLAQNLAIDSGNTWTYLAAGEGSYYQQFNGNHYFGTAVSGSAGADATVNTKMFIDSSGDVRLAANATGAALIKGVSGDQTDRNTGGYPQFTFVGNEGTGMRRPVTNVLAFDTSGDERMRIDSSGNVGIGTTSPSAPLDIVTDSVVYAAEFTQSKTSNGDGVLINIGSAAAADYALTVRSNAGNTSVLACKGDGKVGIGTFVPASKLHVEGAGNQLVLLNNSSTNDGLYLKAGTGESAIQTNGGSHLINFYTSGNARMRIHSNGVVSASEGIALGAGLGNTAANVIDDYEEGTWTPALSGITTNSSTMYGIYTKIGRICHIHAKISVTVASLPGATFVITGLPFTSKDASDAGQRAIIAVGGDMTNVGGNGHKLQFRTNGTNLQGVWINSGSTAYFTYNLMDHTVFEISIHGHYTV